MLSGALQTWLRAASPCLALSFSCCRGEIGGFPPGHSRGLKHCPRVTTPVLFCFQQPRPSQKSEILGLVQKLHSLVRGCIPPDLGGVSNPFASLVFAGSHSPEEGGEPGSPGAPSCLSQGGNPIPVFGGEGEAFEAANLTPGRCSFPFLFPVGSGWPAPLASSPPRKGTPWPSTWSSTPLTNSATSFCEARRGLAVFLLPWGLFPLQPVTGWVCRPRKGGREPNDTGSPYLTSTPLTTVQS